MMGCVGLVTRREKEKRIISRHDLSCYTVQLRLRMRLTSGGCILPLIPGLVLNARTVVRVFEVMLLAPNAVRIVGISSD